MFNSIHLKYFYDAVRLNSISKAAECNCVSQSAVSQAIVRLEKVLKQPLLHHSKRSLQPTSKGKLLFEKAASILAMHEDIANCFDESRSSLKGTLALACTHSLALSLLCPAISLLASKYPAVSLRLLMGNPTIVKERLLRGEADLGIVIGNDDLSSFDSFPLLEGHFRLFQSKKHEDLHSLPILMSEDRFETNGLRQWLEERKNIFAREVGSWEMIAKMTEEGLGIGFLPDYIAASNRFAIEEANIKGPHLPYRLLIIWTKRSSLSPLSRVVRDTIKESMSPPAN